MASADEEFMSRLRATFKVEAEEHLQAISTTLLELEKSPSGMAATAGIESVYREAHSLKGAARAADFSEIEGICQAVESVFAGWKRDLSGPSPDSLDALHGALDMIHALLEKAGKESAQQDSSRDELIHRLGRFQSDAPSPPQPQWSPPPAQPTPAPPPANPPAQPEKAVAAHTVRIPIEKLDSRLFQAEEMLMVKATVAQRAGDLGELAGRFDIWQREWAKVSVDARTLGQALEHQTVSSIRGISLELGGALVSFLDWNFDFIGSLKNKIQSLAAQAGHDRYGVSRRVDDLLEDSKRLLMLPFSTMAGIFPKLVRDLCRDQGKEAEIAVNGGEIEIDKRILEQMKDALVHILRNCVDHGVEPPEERQRLGKPQSAAITISVCAVSGNKVEILVSDDGAGVDLPRVKDCAVRHGIISAAQASAMSDAEATDLVFHSEVSTSPTVTPISGRGLGMSIVRAQTEKLGGQVSIQSVPQKGTSIRMLLPLTLATFRGVILAVGDRTFVVPTANVERVGRVNPQDIRTVENQQTIVIDGRAVSLARLESALELPPKSSGGDDPGPWPIVLLHSGDVRLAFVVDQVLREEEVLVKPPRKPLVRVRNIAGVAVLGSGKTVPLLNVADLVQTASIHGSAPRAGASAAAPPQPPAKRVLVAEDSITSRMLLKGILEGAGYVVRTVVDGMDAFTVLREDQFDLVVSDVEMPRMNGFDLTRRIRADKQLGELPVVLVSALESREERERGIDAGASAYLIKSNFDQSNLLETLQRLA